MLDTLLEARERVLVGLVTAVVLWLLGRGIGALVRRRYLKRERPSFAHVMSRVTVIVASTLGVLAAVTIVFPTVKPVNVLGSLGFFSIAVGFAFRDILENLLAGLLLLFRAPFRTGDEVAVQDVRGRVIEINLRETVIRTYDGRQVLIPNATVYKNPITVQTGYASVRDEAVVGVAYDTDLGEAARIAREVLTRVDGVLDEPTPTVLVADLGDSTIEVRLLFWTAPQQAQVRAVRDRVLRAVVRAYDEAGVEMPTDIVQLSGRVAITSPEERTPKGGPREEDRPSGRAEEQRD